MLPVGVPLANGRHQSAFWDTHPCLRSRCVADQPWYQRDENARLVGELRTAVGEGADLLVFLGAGLSYGVGRGRGGLDVTAFDDGHRFPSWPGLLQRMQSRLHALPELAPFAESLQEFFAEQPAPDQAQLFRDRIGHPNYLTFLREQFASRPNDERRLTRSHHELTKLPLKLLFTTNYDELIEIAFRSAGLDLRVSATQDEFRAHAQQRPDRHLIKLHGSIDRPETIVLTRDDYAASRRERAEMFRYLGHELRYTKFLFVGFSLSDPNFALLYDDARLAFDGALPTSYVVQGRPDPVKDAYLRSLGMNTISLDWWEDLPQFLAAINPNAT
jgi:hypothetical protein